jgi:hypothetical protein
MIARAVTSSEQGEGVDGERSFAELKGMSANFKAGWCRDFASLPRLAAIFEKFGLTMVTLLRPHGFVKKHWRPQATWAATFIGTLLG